MKTRSEKREAAIKIIYKIIIYEEAKVSYDLEEVIKEDSEIQSDFVNQLVKGVLDNRQELETLANKYLKNWTLKRLNKVDEAIFLLAVYELKYIDTPSIVTINEWLDLSKKYSDEKVTDMLNAVLDNIYHSEENNE